MKLTQSRWIIFSIVSLLASGLHTAALANGTDYGFSESSDGQPDQKQKEADMAYAQQLESAYQSQKSALDQAYQEYHQKLRAGTATNADRQNIEGLQAAVNSTISQKQANAQDLQRGNQSNPYAIPSEVSHPIPGQNNGQGGWDRRQDPRPQGQGGWQQNQNSNPNPNPNPYPGQPYNNPRRQPDSRWQNDGRPQGPSSRHNDWRRRRGNGDSAPSSSDSTVDSSQT